MKKHSNKIKIGIVLCMAAAIIFGTIKIYGEIQLGVNDTQTIEKVEVTEVETALAAIAKNNVDKSINSQDMVKFMEWIKLYNPTDEAIKTVAELIREGADVDALLAVCVFWEDTDMPFSVVEQILCQGDGSIDTLSFL